MKWYKIDDVAKITGLTKRTLRYYEEIGLIKPPERSNGKFRLYTDEDIEQIRKLILAREVLGFSLQELQEFLSLKEKVERHSEEYNRLSPYELQEIDQNLKQQIRMIETKMERMRKFIEELEDLRQKIQSHQNLTEKEDV
jgi:DNA-binding transcriptional MerR regulator